MTPEQQSIQTTQPVSLIRSTATVKVVLTEIDVPFWNIVFAMIKWSIAAIPAMIILTLVVFGISTLLLAMGLVAHFAK